MSFGRLGASRPVAPFSAINITPLVDVVLVLLVVFILSAPLMARQLALDVSPPAPPHVAAAVSPDAPGPAPVAVVELDAAGGVRLDGRALDAAALRAGLQALAASHPGAEVRLRANVGVPYGQVAALIGTVQAAGLSRIGFEAEASPRAR